ncbi:nose resistant to fluoxetine protein 6-like [Ornithodoros turicata]|uniref:nose resistant to fluoxetine protein 6-like n=1 Tax=Ornithodoros turicata TaxID=34597 RepID=UPI003138F526
MLVPNVRWTAIVFIGVVASQCLAHLPEHRRAPDGEERRRAVRSVDLGNDESQDTEERQDLKTAIEDALAKLMKMALPYVQELAYDENIATECMNSLFKVGAGLRRYDFWALKFIDSMGRPPAGLLEFSTGANGAYDECRSIRAPKDESDEEDFRGQYCTIYFRPDSIDQFAIGLVEKFMSQHPLFRVHLKNIGNLTEFLARIQGMNELPSDPRLTDAVGGMPLSVCVPSKCSPHDLRYIAEKFVKKYGIIVSVKGCTVDKPVQLTTVQVAMFALLGLLCFMVGISSVIDIYIRERRYELHVKPRQRPLPLRMLLAFSAVTNTEILMKTKTEPNSSARRLRCLHGIRVFSFLWVLIGHSYSSHSPNFIGRGIGALEAISDVSFSLIMNGFLALQTFFFIGAFLVTQGMIANRHVPFFKSIPLAIVRRYIRLTVPALFFVGLFFLYPLVVTGPTVDELLWVMVENCANYWWDSITYTSNYREMTKICMPHLWYLSADYQLFLLLIVFAALVALKPKYGVPATAAITAASAIALFLQSYLNDYGPLVITTRRGINETTQAYENMYQKPLTYLPTFAMGILCAYIVNRHKDFRIGTVLYYATWALAWPAGLAILFSTYGWNNGAPYTNFTSAFHFIGHRIGWGLCLTWVIFVCSTGQARWVNGLLSHPFFVPLSRLSFAGYMLHVLVIAVRPLSSRMNLYLDHWTMVRDFFGHSAITILVAYLFFLVCECPTVNLDKIIFDRAVPKDKNVQPNSVQLDEKKTVPKTVSNGSTVTSYANGVTCCHL